MPPDEDVSTPEVVRWLKRIDGRLDELGRNVVSREVYDVRNKATDEALAELARHVERVEKALDRHQREHAQTWQSWVQPTVLSLIASGIAVALSQIIGG